MIERTLPRLRLGGAFERPAALGPAAGSGGIAGSAHEEACATSQAKARAAQGAAARVAARRSEAILSTPARAGMLLGASAAVYAVTLAGVSGLQAQQDAAVIAARQPSVDRIAAVRAANDSLEASLVAIDAKARTLASDYAAAGGDISSYQARLDELAGLVATIQGSAAALPTRIALPSVSMHGKVGSSKAPATSSTTGASGG